MAMHSIEYDAEVVEVVARAIQDAHAPGHPLCHISLYQARAAIAAINAIAAMPGVGWQRIEPANPVGINCPACDGEGCEICGHSGRIFTLPPAPAKE